MIDIIKDPQCDMHRKDMVIYTSRNHALNDEPTYVQPEKCKRCVWGEWTGTKQWCSKTEDNCVKEVEVYDRSN